MRLVQLSDLHYLPAGELLYGQIDTHAAALAAFARIETLQPDLLLLTGDLLERPTAAIYVEFMGQLRRLPCPAVALPGNHDQPTLLAEAFGTNAGPHQRLTMPTGGALLLLDSTIPGAEHGAITPAHIDWLNAHHQVGQPTVLALHHPPCRTGIAGMDAIGCHGSELLAEWLALHPEIAAVLCGHVHRLIGTTFAQRPLWIAPSPAHQISPDLDGQPLAWCDEPGGMLLHDWLPGHSLTTHYLPIIPGRRTPYPES
jgi:3',5'-cyclic AMP phosphodiesterase CpdA